MPNDRVPYAQMVDTMVLGSIANRMHALLPPRNARTKGDDMPTAWDPLAPPFLDRLIIRMQERLWTKAPTTRPAS
jgi:hypothetical protein